MTQYCLRNTYYGSFKNGKRDGQGTFLYADGSKYEGTWKENLKSGWVRFLFCSVLSSILIHIIFIFTTLFKGKYTSKDAKVFESFFEDDKITDSPTFKKASIFASEINQVNTRLPSGEPHLPRI